jgi:hypothetical protein
MKSKPGYSYPRERWKAVNFPQAFSWVKKGAAITAPCANGGNSGVRLDGIKLNS